jgi:O-antigen biosynthesis protein WbqV
MKLSNININRTYAVAAHDVFMAAASFVLALWLRRGGEQFLTESSNFLVGGLLIFTAVAVVVFWRLRVYRGFWRYTAMRDVMKIVQAASLTVLIFLPILFIITRLDTYPRSALLINWFVMIALLIGPRVLYRALLDGSLRGITQRTGAGKRIPVLLVGVGDHAELFIRSTTQGASANYRVVGLIDDDPKKIGRYIHGIRVFGSALQLTDVLRKLKRRGMQPRRIILTPDSLEPERVRALLAAAEGVGLTLARLPRLDDFRHGDDTRIEPRPVAVEDLLGRPQTVLDRAAMKTFIAGRRVLVTGAGGTIGAELVRQIAAYAPSQISLVDSGEYNLYQIDMELAESHAALPRQAILGDVRDRGRLRSSFAAVKPDIVFHAAALKHVHMVEANPNEGVLTNVIGTRNVADACVEAGVSTMVLISSDKAVNPTGVMGATKRAAECYCQALGTSEGRDAGTHFVTVRFGNVLGSSGSVVPLFQRQIAAGGPVTVTDPDVTRYFMTTREAVQLVLQASALGATETDGPIYVLEMGQPMKIDELARQMIQLAGYVPGREIDIVYTGLRAGEKRAEELFHAAEPLVATRTAGVMRATSRAADLALLRRQFDQLGAAAHDRRTADTLALIRAMVPEYAPTKEREPLRLAR